MKKIDTTKDGEITKKNKSRKEKSIEGNRDAGSQSEGGRCRESLYNDAIINAAQHPLFTETR
jgi:hypothetical protein